MEFKYAVFLAFFAVPFYFDQITEKFPETLQQFMSKWGIIME